MSIPYSLGVAVFVPAAVIAAWAAAAAEPARRPLEVVVGLPPYAYLVERIAGQHVAIQVLLQAGQDPHTFALTPKQMAALGRARLLLTIGMPFEKRLAEKVEGAGLPLKVVDVAAGIRKRSMDAGQDGSHDDHGHGHAAGDPDPHVWLSPPLLKVQATNIAKALEQIDPAHAADYEKNLAALHQDLDATHAKLSKLLGPCRGTPLLVFHPAFGYFADTYGLEQEAVEAGGKPPAPRQLRALIQKARAENVKVIFVQPQYDPRTAQTVADAIGGKVVPIDDLRKDVLRNLEDIAAKIVTR
jgi:zinc transport system substrate-binding protein